MKKIHPTKSLTKSKLTSRCRQLKLELGRRRLSKVSHKLAIKTQTKAEIVANKIQAP